MDSFCANISLSLVGYNFMNIKIVTLPGIFFTWKHPKFARAEILFYLLSKEEKTPMPAMHLRLGKE